MPSERTLCEYIAKENNDRVLREHRRPPRSHTGSHLYEDDEPPTTIYPDSVSVEELEDFIREHYDNLNKEFQEWEALIFTVLDIFISCLHYDPMQHVK